jgi:hypothetical protein
MFLLVALPLTSQYAVVIKEQIKTSGPSCKKKNICGEKTLFGEGFLYHHEEMFCVHFPKRVNILFYGLDPGCSTSHYRNRALCRAPT